MTTGDQDWNSVRSLRRRDKSETTTTHPHGVIVSSPQSDRLLTLLVRLGFTAERSGRSQLRVDGSTRDEVRRFALLFDIQAHPGSGSESCSHRHEIGVREGDGHAPPGRQLYGR